MQVWPGGPYSEMAYINNERNKKYCEKWGFDWELHIGTLDPKYADYRVGSWVKVEQIIRALQEPYRYVVSLEPDTLIRDFNTDLRDGCPNGVGACWHRHHVGHQWNVGALYMQNTPDVRACIDEWLKEFPAEPVWRDNGAFNVVGKRNKTIQTISDRWNATLDVSMVPDAVVLGFHGVGASSQARLDTMKLALKSI